VSFDVVSFDVVSFDVVSFDVVSFDVVSFDVLDAPPCTKSKGWRVCTSRDTCVYILRYVCVYTRVCVCDCVRVCMSRIRIFMNMRIHHSNTLNYRSLLQNIVSFIGLFCRI